MHSEVCAKAACLIRPNQNRGANENDREAKKEFWFHRLLEHL